MMRVHEKIIDKKTGVPFHQIRVFEALKFVARDLFRLE
jgi:hypothetical protein